MASINIVQLYQALAEKQRRRRESYTAILRLCEKHIKAVAGNDGMRCVYTVPEFRLGMPPYNLNDCIRYIKTELEKAGFIVLYHFPNILHISWDVADLEKNSPPPAAASAQQRPSAPAVAKPIAEALPAKKPKKQQSNGKFFLSLE